MEIISWLLCKGHGALGAARKAGPCPDVRMIQVTDLLREWRICTASKADLEPPITTTSSTCEVLRIGTLAARERVWIIGGVKLSRGNDGIFGVEVRPVAIISFSQVNEASESVDTVHNFPALVM